MRKSGSWIGAVVKRVFSPEHKEKKTQSEEQKTPKSSFTRKWGFGRVKPPDLDSNRQPETPTLPPSLPDTPTLPLHHPGKSAARVGDVGPQYFEPDENKNVYAAALATAEAAVAAAKAAAEVVRLTTTGKNVKSSEEEATIKIQMAIRGYLARRSLQVLRGSARLKSVMRSNGLRRQTGNTLRCVQTMSRFQSQIRLRRLRMTEENQKIQKHLQLKQEREVEFAKEAEKEEEVEWDSTQQSKEKVEASAISKQEAGVRRERALAYAFSHQWKAPSRTISPMFTNPTNPQWGWSWLERWMVANRSTPSERVKEKKHINPTKTGIEGEITNIAIGGKSSSSVDVGENKLIRRGSGRQFPSTVTPSKPTSISGGKIHSSNPRAGYHPIEYDTRSILSIRSERARRQSLAGSSVRDDDSLASSPAVPNYMASTESARARSRYLNSASCRFSDSGSTTSSAKKRFSFPASDNPRLLSLAEVVRRHSAGPAPRSEISTVKDILSQPQEDHDWQ